VTKRSPYLLAFAALLLSGCNETIDQEIAHRCHLSSDEWQKAQGVLDAGSDGMAIHAGICRLTRKSKDEIQGEVVGSDAH